MFDNGTDEFVVDFLAFVGACHQLMGQANLYGQRTMDLARVNIEISGPTELTSEIITANWGQLARTWAVLETPINYGLTMSSILEFFKANDRLRGDHKELDVSLGAGPGLYELYLANLFEQTPGLERLRLICLDAAPAMTAYTNELIEKLRKGTPLKIKNIRAVTGDMTTLPFADRSVSQLLVNNSLGWVPNWQQAIAEMARVISPDQLGYAYFVVHPHPMVLRDQQGSRLHQLNDMSATDLMDKLEKNGCGIDFTRLMAGRGTGQAGNDTNRIFIKGQFTSGDPGSWRERAEKNQVKTSNRFL